MTTDRQLQANKLNALKSAGPKSARGKKQASQNALRHGLSTPLPLYLIEGKQEKIAASIMLDGFDSVTALELAAKIIEFERNMAYQRTLFSEDSSGPKSYEGALADRYAKNAQEVENAIMDCPAKAHKTLRSLGKSFQRSAAMYFSIEADRRKRSLRYVRRSSNQLIKLLKRIVSVSELGEDVRGV